MFQQTIMNCFIYISLIPFNFLLWVCSPCTSNAPSEQPWMPTNISSVVEFQRWWVLKSKLFAQESTCLKEILISTSLNHLWFSVVGVKKADYLDFPCEKFEILCELDVGIIACNFWVFEIFSFFSNFFRSNSFIFEQKVEKIHMGFFSTQVVLLNSNLAPKIM